MKLTELITETKNLETLEDCKEYYDTVTKLFNTTVLHKGDDVDQETFDELISVRDQMVDIRKNWDEMVMVDHRLLIDTTRMLQVAVKSQLERALIDFAVEDLNN